MNIIRVYGGLGNQLFQYAFGQAMRANGIKVGYETAWYEKNYQPPRPYCLDKFNTNVEVSPFSMVNRTIRETGFDPRLTHLKNCNFYGYWQSPRYFETIKEQISQEIQVKPEFCTDEFSNILIKIANCNSVALHVRRGDYVNKGHHLLSLDYYLKGIRLIESLTSNAKIFVFSDDLDWCKVQFSDVEFVQLKEDYLEFELMRLCTHNIIANSTFSWWAAYLNPNPNKIVICPGKWMVNDDNQALIEQKGLLLDSWIKI